MRESPRGGVLPLDKPEGPTSHDMVARARRALGTRRVGHTGTLDPFASGLLLLCVGPATRIAEYLSGLPKSYAAVARLGEATDTLDRTGAVVSSSDSWRDLDPAAVAEALQSQVGDRLQRPPAYSAKKVGGERLHRIARRGDTVDVPAVPVTIHHITVDRIALPEVSFRVTCSSGTYVRAIARDMGEALGVGAHLTALRRTSIGGHDIGSAISAEQLEDAEAVARAWIDPLRALSHLPRLDVNGSAAADLAHGRRVPAPETAPSGETTLVAHEGKLLAIARIAEGRIQPRKVFAGD